MLAAEFDYVCAADPAVDSEREDFAEQWRLYLDGKGEPPLLPDASPATFTLRPLGHKQRAYAANAGKLGGLDMAALTAAQLAIVGVQGLGGDKPVSISRIRIDGLSMLDDASLNSIPADLLMEIGLVIWGRSNPRPL